MHQNAYMQVLLEIMVVNNPLIKPYVLERWCLLQGCIDSHEGGKELDISSWYITDTSGYLAIRYSYIPCLYTVSPLHLHGLVSKFRGPETNVLLRPLGLSHEVPFQKNKWWNDSLIEGFVQILGMIFCESCLTGQCSPPI